MSGPQADAGGVRRRELLGGAALLGAIGAIGLAPILPRTGEPGVIVFDSTQPASRAFAKLGGAARRIDLVAEDRTSWRALRSLGRALPVAGYTSWAAYVTARLCLEGQGLRMVSEALDRRRGLVAWRMA